MTVLPVCVSTHKRMFNMRLEISKTCLWLEHCTEIVIAVNFSAVCLHKNLLVTCGPLGLLHVEFLSGLPRIV